MRRLWWLLVCLVLVLASTGDSQAQPLWTYVVNAAGDGSSLDVSATLEDPGTAELSVNDGAEPYLKHLQVRHGDDWADVAARGTSWYVDPHPKVELRYHYDLRGSAGARRHRGATATSGPMIVSPGAFLLRPVRGAAGLVRFTVLTQSPTRFVSGYHQVHPNTWQARAEDLFMGPDSVMGDVATMPLEVPGAHLQIAYVPGSLKFSDADMAGWIHDKLAAVATYFGKLPLAEGLIIALPIDGDDVHGEARGGSGFSVRLGVGRDVTLADARADWTLTHEMVHVCTPSLPAPQHWMEEGIATYLEPIIRVRVGDLTAQKVWGDMLDGMPKGQPDSKDAGLNGTDAWGRTYWGGAAFWLLADVQIRVRTHGQKSLRDALMGMIHHGASIAEEWKPAQVLQAGDEATGVNVLHELYASMGEKPKTVDLDALWHSLGVRATKDGVVFFDAPEAAVREAMTRP